MIKCADLNFACMKFLCDNREVNNRLLCIISEESFNSVPMNDLIDMMNGVDMSDPAQADTALDVSIVPDIR